MPYSGATKVINHGGIVAILHAMATFNNAGRGPFDPVSKTRVKHAVTIILLNLNTVQIRMTKADVTQGLQEEGCRLLCDLAHQNQDARASIVQSNGKQIVRDIMESHQDKSGIQEAGQDLLDRLYDRKHEHLPMGRSLEEDRMEPYRV